MRQPQRANGRSLVDLAPRRDGVYQALDNLRRREERSILAELIGVNLNNLGVANDTVEELRDLQARSRRFLDETT